MRGCAKVCCFDSSCLSSVFVSHFIVSNFLSVAVQLSKWEPADTTGKINFRSHYDSWLCVCVHASVRACERIYVCVFVRACLPALWPVTMRTARGVTSLQQCDVITRRWLILLAHLWVREREKERERVWKCEVSIKRNTWAEASQQNNTSMSTSMCFILCNKNNYGAFVLGV